MTTVRTMHGLTEAELDALIDARQEAARDAALIMIERAKRHGQDCAPCHGNCQQGDTCPARLRAQVAADARDSDVPAHWLAVGLVAVVLVSAGLGTATRMGWW